MPFAFGDRFEAREARCEGAGSVYGLRPLCLVRADTCVRADVHRKASDNLPHLRHESATAPSSWVA